MFSLFSKAAVRRGLTLGAVALVAFAQACGSDSSTAPRNNNDNSDPTGIYKLRTVDGKNLPYQISRSPFFDAATGHFYNEYDVTVTGGGWDLDELGFADFWIDLSIKGDGVPMTQHKESFGIYQVQGSGAVIVTFFDVGSATLPLNNGQIQLSLDLLNKGVSNNYVFRR